MDLAGNTGKYKQEAVYQLPHGTAGCDENDPNLDRIRRKRPKSTTDFEFPTGNGMLAIIFLPIETDPFFGKIEKGIEAWDQHTIRRQSPLDIYIGLHTPIP